MPLPSALLCPRSLTEWRAQAPALLVPPSLSEPPTIIRTEAMDDDVAQKMLAVDKENRELKVRLGQMVLKADHERES